MFKSLVAICSVGVLTAAPIPKELRTPDDKARFVGTWKTEKIVDGERPREVILHTIIVTADGKAQALYHQGLKDVHWALRLDPPAKRVSLVLDGPHGVGCECAYEFRDGKLLLAFARDVKNPPASVDPGPNVAVYHLTRTDAK